MCSIKSVSHDHGNDCDLAIVTRKTDIGTQKFTTKKTVREGGRKKHIFRDFDPLGYWGIDNRHQIVAYKPIDRDKFGIFTGGYPGTSKGIMQHVNGQVDNGLILGRFISRNYRYTVNLFENRFAHLVDTTPGQSGSPVWRPSSHVRRMIGIVTLVRETFNEGVALTPNFLREIVDWAPRTFRFDGKRLRVRR